MFAGTPKGKLEDVAVITMGQSPSGKSYNENGKGTPFYQGKTEFGDLYIGDAVTWTTEPTRFADANDVLMSVRAPVGSTNIATQRCCLGRGLAGLRPIPGKSTTMFILYSMRSIEEEIDNMGVGSTFKAINKKQVHELPIPLADIQLQDRFVELAEQSDKSQFMEQFSDEQETILLKKAFELQMGKTPARAEKRLWQSSDHKWISIADMSTYNKYTADTKEYLSDLAVRETGIKIVPKNTVIMSFKLTIGRTAITSEDIYTNEAIMAFIPQKDIFDLEYLRHALSYYDWSGGLQNAVKGATLNKAIIGNVEFPVPSMERQRRFAEFVAQSDKSKYLLQNWYEIMNQVDRRLLTCLMKTTRLSR